MQYRDASWHQPRRVVAKVEWRQGELFPREGFIVTNLNKRAKGREALDKLNRSPEPIDLFAETWTSLSPLVGFVLPDE